MGKTNHRVNRSYIPKNDPPKKEKYNDNYKGMSYTDFDDDDDEFEWFDNFREE